ncbi:hypothetical protein [Pseudoblastomonas halimionae]|uniref:Lipoprotein n=1 Tax=Alteriqipengyuania halimionae TaxID=1926630 RepID=A0A6I4U1R7_9SPHN|nr:hypothetical protein [Alteriqipengyuania halimionae]MXP08885.1 hypothetical protein [Alteriqipengyuania halimionae]
MRTRLFLYAPMATLALALAACSDNEDTADTQGEQDPATAGALGEDIMVDPDRIDQAGKDGVLKGGDPASAAIPMDPETREQVNKAREEARQLLGGGRIADAPAPGDGFTDTLVGAAQAIQRGNSGVNCASGAEYSATWADRMPEPFTVYPRGAVLEAAGNDEQGCALRVTEFTTAVPAQDVVNFYNARARKAGFSASLMRDEEGGTVIGGRKGDAAYYIAVDKREDGLTLVQLMARAGS